MNSVSINALDGMNSLLWTGNRNSTQDFTYTPYGTTPPRHGNGNGNGGDGPQTGYNGERLDPVSQSYHLGNGYRAYNPTLMRFNAPDSWSPFGSGGLNMYAYCEGDPINRSDPSGHMSWQAGVGIGLGILGVLGAVFSFGSSLAAVAAGEAALTASMAVDLAVGAAGVAAGATGVASMATQQSDPSASKILGWVSFGLGIVSLASHGMSRLAGSVEGLSKRLGPVTTEGLSGRGAAWAASAMDEDDYSVSIGITLDPRSMIHYKSITFTHSSDRGKALAFYGNNPGRGERIRQLEEPITVTPGTSVELPVIRTRSAIPGAGYTTDNTVCLLGRLQPMAAGRAPEEEVTIEIQQMIEGLPDRQAEAYIRSINIRAGADIQTRIPPGATRFTRGTPASIKFNITGVLAPPTNNVIIDYVLLGK